MKIAPIGATWPELQAFYRKLSDDFHKNGISSLTTGGIACVLYELVQSTKVCDIIIPIGKIDAAINILAATDLLGHKCHLTLKYGAPLDHKWLRGGWSSHTFFGTAPQPVARVDIFGRPPRVSKLTSDENPLYLSRSGVAQMKKTRREKDWAFVNLLGAQMLEHGDIAGVLHISDPSLLRESVRSSELPPEFILERPTLTLAVSDSPELTRYVKAEKEFWIRLDDLRLSAYEEAWKPYGAILQQNPDLLTLDFPVQNRQMIAIAEKTLDPAPLTTKGWSNLVNQAKSETGNIFHDLDLNLLPSPNAFFAENENSPVPDL